MTPRPGDPVICYDCGNAPDSEFPRLVYAERAGGMTLVHADYEHPDLPDGWDTCYECERAAPMTQLLAAEVVVTRKDGTQRVIGTAHVCLGTCLDAHPGASVMDEGSVSISHPLFNHRHPKVKAPPVERDDDRRDRVDVKHDALVGRADALPASSRVTLAEAAGLWGVGERQARGIIKDLLAADLVEVSEETTGRGGTPRKVYRRRVQ